jgi:hypothetical protein
MVSQIPGAENVFVPNFAAPVGACWKWCIDGNIDDSAYSSAAEALAVLQEHVNSGSTLGQQAGRVL